MPTQQELLDIMLRQRLLDQETGNTRALQARAGMQLPGPISPDQLQQMVAQSQMRQRMGVDPQAARFRKMLANPAQAPVDPNADTEADVARKAALARMALLPGGKRVDASTITPGQMADYQGMERARFRPDSEFMAQRAERMKRGSAAADASRSKSANLAFRRGVLNPTAETTYAQQGVIPDRMAQAVANRIAMIQAMHPVAQHGNPIQALIADRLRSNPAALDSIVGRMTGGETPDAAPEPGSLPVPPPTTKIVGRGTITTTPPNPNIPNAPPGQPSGVIRINPDGSKVFRDPATGRVQIIPPEKRVSPVDFTPSFPLQF